MLGSESNQTRYLRSFLSYPWVVSSEIIVPKLVSASEESFTALMLSRQLLVTQRRRALPPVSWRCC